MRHSACLNELQQYTKGNYQFNQLVKWLSLKMQFPMYALVCGRILLGRVQEP